MQSKIKQMLEDHEIRIKKLEERMLISYGNNLCQQIEEKKEGKPLSQLPSGDTNQADKLSIQDDTKLQSERSASLPVDNHPLADNSPQVVTQTETRKVLDEEKEDNIPKKRGRKPKYEKTN